VGVTDDLDETFVLADDARAGIGAEGELADFHVVSGLAGFGFGEADAADFGMAVGGAGDVFGIDRLAGLAGDFGDGNEGYDGADGVDAGLRGLHPGIGFEEAAVGLDFGALEADVLGTRLAADGDQDFFGIDFLLFAVDSDGDGDDRYFGVERAVDRCEFDANGSGADDNKRLRNLFQAEDLDIGENAIVGLEAGQHAGFGAGGEDDVLRFELCGL